MDVTYNIGVSPASWERAMIPIVQDNLEIIAGGKIPSLFTSKVRYRREPKEDWKNILDILDDGHGDCEDLAMWRSAELIHNGIQARPVIIKTGNHLYHAVVELPDGRLLDPSKTLGMGKKNKKAKIKMENKIQYDVRPEGLGYIGIISLPATIHNDLNNEEVDDSVQIPGEIAGTPEQALQNAIDRTIRVQKNMDIPVVNACHSDQISGIGYFPEEIGFDLSSMMGMMSPMMGMKQPQQQQNPMFSMFGKSNPMAQMMTQNPFAQAMPGFGMPQSGGMGGMNFANMFANPLSMLSPGQGNDMMNQLLKNPALASMAKTVPGGALALQLMQNPMVQQMGKMALSQGGKLAKKGFKKGKKKAKKAWKKFKSWF